MSRLRRLVQRLSTRQARLWAAAILAVALLHLGLFAILPNPRWQPPTARADHEVAPIYLQITPRARVPQRPVANAPQGAQVPFPPVVVREARAAAATPEVAPLVVETPPPTVRARVPGRVIPRSWRERCGLGDGEVSESAYQACRNLFLNAAAPPPSPARRGRGDPSQDLAAQGAARLAAYEAQRAPAPTGSGNAGPSSTPGSNFGMGEIDRSVIYVQGERPRTGE